MALARYIEHAPLSFEQAQNYFDSLKRRVMRYRDARGQRRLPNVFYLDVFGGKKRQQDVNRRGQGLRLRLWFAATHVAERPHAIPLQGEGGRLGDVEQQALEGFWGAENNVAEILAAQGGCHPVRMRSSRITRDTR